MLPAVRLLNFNLQELGMNDTSRQFYTVKNTFLHMMQMSMRTDTKAFV